MLKRLSIRKIAVTTSALLILVMFYFFPVNDKQIDFKYEVEYIEEENLKVVYLLNGDEYLALLNINIDAESDLELIKEKITLLTRGSEKRGDVPKGFNAIIPINTKLDDLKLDGNVVTLNFSKELLDIESELEEKMIESIVYSLTELKNVEKIKILVEGKVLSHLPNSNKKLPEYFTRDYGINKKYDLTKLDESIKTTIYYTSSYDEDVYYVPVTKVTNDEKEKITVIINELKSTVVSQENLGSFLSNDVVLEDYELVDNTMTLTFNEKIFDGFDAKDILEEVKYAISMSVIENYGVKEVIFNIKDNEKTFSVSKTLE